MGKGGNMVEIRQIWRGMIIKSIQKNLKFNSKFGNQWNLCRIGMLEERMGFWKWYELTNSEQDEVYEGICEEVQKDKN